MNTHTRHVLSQAKTTINGTHVVFWGWLESREGGGRRVGNSPTREKACRVETCMECFNECHQCRRRRKRKRGAADDGSV